MAAVISRRGIGASIPVTYMMAPININTMAMTSSEFVTDLLWGPD